MSANSPFPKPATATRADDFPVLVDVVGNQAVPTPTLTPAPTATSRAASTIPVVNQPVAPAVLKVAEPADVTLTPEQLTRLELEVREAVLKSLSQRMDMILEARIREKLTDLLEQVLAGMTAELKTSMRDLMREVVARSVAQELSSAQAKLAKKPDEL